MTLFDATNARGLDIKQLNVSEKKYVQNATKSMIGRESVARNDKSANCRGHHPSYHRHGPKRQVELSVRNRGWEGMKPAPKATQPPKQFKISQLEFPSIPRAMAQHVATTRQSLNQQESATLKEEIQALRAQNSQILTLLTRILKSNHNIARDEQTEQELEAIINASKNTANAETTENKKTKSRKRKTQEKGDRAGQTDKKTSKRLEKAPGPE